MAVAYSRQHGRIALSRELIFEAGFSIEIKNRLLHRSAVVTAAQRKEEWKNYGTIDRHLFDWHDANMSETEKQFSITAPASKKQRL
jgi:hypothetical protein